MVEPLDDVGDIVLLDRISLIVQGEAIGLHVVEPYLFRATGTGLCEDEDRRGDTGIGFEDAGGHGNHRPELVILYQFLTDGLMGFAAAEEHSVRHDAGAAATLLQHPKEEVQEEKLRLLRIGDSLQVIINAFLIDGTLEWRIGQTEREGVANFILLGQTVLVLDIRIGNGKWVL